MPDALPGATLTIYLGLGLAQGDTIACAYSVAGLWDIPGYVLKNYLTPSHSPLLAMEMGKEPTQIKGSICRQSNCEVPIFKNVSQSFTFLEKLLSNVGKCLRLTATVH